MGCEQAEDYIRRMPTYPLYGRISPGMSRAVSSKASRGMHGLYQKLNDD